MEKEIVKNLEPEEQSRMSVENAEINILYTTAFAIYILAQDAERRMNNSGMSLGFRRKQLFNGIIKDLQGAKRKQDELYDDYVKAWGKQTKNYDEEQENANSLARLLMLWFDRVEGWEDKEKAVEEFIKTLSPEDAVTPEALQRFYVKKMKEAY